MTTRFRLLGGVAACSMSEGELSDESEAESQLTGCCVCVGEGISS